jgi:hypothetical protein
MTESPFPFAAPAAEAEAPAESGDRKKLLMVGGAGALVVAVLGYFVVVPVLTGGSGDDTPVTTVRKKPAVTAAQKPAAKPAAKKPVVQPQSYNDVQARTDPFKPLVVEPVAAPVAPPAAPAAPGGTAAPAPAGGSGTTAGSSTTVQGQRVILLHVYKRDGKSYAQTKVGDKVYSPALGDVFAGSYKLLAVSGKSATYLFGDEQFSLSEGQEVLK